MPRIVPPPAATSRAQSRFRAGAAVLGWFALVLQYVLILYADSRFGPFTRTVNFFSFFTILSNIMVAAAFTARRGWTENCDVRAAILVYICIVGLVYHAVLASLWAPQGWQLVADQLLHSVMPLLYLLDWILFVPKGQIAARYVPRWLLVPLLYGVWTQIYGGLSGFYPYPFIDGARLRVGEVVANMALVLAVFAVVGLVVVGLDRVLAARTLSRNATDGYNDR